MKRVNVVPSIFSYDCAETPRKKSQGRKRSQRPKQLDSANSAACDAATSMVQLSEHNYNTTGAEAEATVTGMLCRCR